MTSIWPPDKLAAVSLSFDGGTSAQFDALRNLAEIGVRGTLYLDAPTLLDNLSASRDLADEGVELGNLALHAATDADGLIARMPEQAVADEIRSLKDLLLAMFDRRHSAAMPLVRSFTGESGLPIIPEIIQRSVVRLNEAMVGDALRECYDTTRTSRDGFCAPDHNRRELLCYRGDQLDAVTLGLVTQIALSQGHWLIIGFGPRADIKPILTYARWLVRQRLWAAPVIEVADWRTEAKQSQQTYDSV